MILYYLKTYCYIFNSFVLKKPYFSISNTNYFINISRQFRVSVRKYTKIVMRMYVILIILL